MATRVFRSDIQVLRAIAVSLVIWFHAELPGLSGGFLGVDIFLVISGYLIANLISRAIEENRFCLLDFFLNRAKRLLPASYIVFLMTGVLGLWLLTENEFDRYLNTLLGALTYTSNITLWQSTNYFSAAAKDNVLLHVWSLSLEEQFYLILPCVMLLAPRRHLTKIMALGFLVSLCLCFLFVQIKPVAVFYLLPTRAWEFLLGTLLALQERRFKGTLRGWAPALSPLVLTFLLIFPVFMPFAAAGFLHPSMDALMVSLFTATVILLQPAFMNNEKLVIRFLVWVGNISYPLYLVHWPLFALARHAYITSDVPMSVRVSLLLVSVFLAWGLHIWIERPMHRMEINSSRWKFAAVILSVTILLFQTVATLPATRPAPREYSFITRPNYGISEECDVKEATIPFSPVCQTGMRPRAILWGDSFAMHIAQALPESIGPFLQATMSSCAPAIGIAQINPGAGQLRRWADQCIAFNDSVLNYLDEHPEIQTVILSSMYSQVLNPKSSGVVRNGRQISIEQFDYSIGMQHFKETVSKIHESGRRIIFIGPTPSNGLNWPICVERRERGLITVDASSDCSISRNSAEEYRGSAKRLLRELVSTNSVEYIDIFDIFCDPEICKPIKDDVLLFRDAGHISIKGAFYIGSHDLLTFP